MEIMSLLIVGSALYSGTKILNQKKNKQRRLANYMQPKLPPDVSTEEAQLRSNSMTPIFSFIKQYNPSCTEMSSNRDNIKAISVEKSTDRNLTISLISLGIATLSTWVYPPLGLVSAAALLYVSVPLFQQAYESLVKERTVKIVVLDAIVSGSCLATGAYIPCALMCSLVYGGRKILAKTEDRSRTSLLDVFGLQSSSVWVYVDGVEVKTSLEDLNTGDVIVVHAGETIPVDGRIVRGISTVDQHILTGESQPVEKEVDDPVFASTVVLTGQIFIEVEQTGQETTAAKIAGILSQTANFKSSLQSRGEAYSDRSALPTLALGTLALLTTGPVAALTILNASFAWYMRVLAPIGMLNFLNIAAQNGILIKDGRVLELLTQVDTVVFDKTGTLTYSEPHVGEIHTYVHYTADEVLRYAAAAEYKQTHPVALAILAEANTRQLIVPQVDEPEYQVGYGILVKFENKIVRVGSTRFMEKEGITLPLSLQKNQENCHAQGHSLVVVAIDQTICGALEMQPTLRPEAKEVISQLRSKYADSFYIISGDHKIPTQKLAEELGIDDYYAETLPAHKADLIAQLQAEGKFVCYIGDGINDSIALKKAQVSVSLLGASTIATDTAQVVLMGENLAPLAQLFETAEKFDANLKQTLKISMVPATIIVSGAFFLHLGLIQSIFINAIGFSTGFFNTMLPRIKHQAKNKCETLEKSAHFLAEAAPIPDKIRLATALYNPPLHSSW